MIKSEVIPLNRIRQGFSNFFPGDPNSASKSYVTQSRKKCHLAKLVRGVILSSFRVSRNVGYFGHMHRRSVFFMTFTTTCFMNFEEGFNKILRHWIRLWTKNGFAAVCLHDKFGGVSIVYLFICNLLGSQKGPRPKPRALATQVWVATHRLKTSGIRTSATSN